MTAISYHDTVKELQGLDWSDDAPFARLEWFRLIEEAGHKPLFAMAREGDNALCLPLARKDDGLASLTNWYAFTSDVLRVGAVHVPTLAKSIADGLRTQTQRVTLSKLAKADCDLLANAFRKAGWVVFQGECDTNHILPVESRPYDDYLAARPGRLRTTLKRKAKKVETVLTTQFNAEDWAAYEAIYVDSWKPEEGDPALLRRFAELESAAGRFRFALARHEGEPVAAQFWTVDNGTAYIHKLAHRPSAEKLSPGTTLTAALMERVIDIDHVALVDFGTGDDAYKRDWMEEKRTRWELTCLRPEAPRNWPLLVKGFIRKLVSRPVSG